MRAKDLIMLLDELIAEHGNLNVVDSYDNDVGPPEVVDNVIVLEAET